MDRWAARGFQWGYSSLPRCRKCGRVTVTPDGTVGVRADGEKVGFAGLSTCGSVWSCPVCNSKVQSVRRLEVGVALASIHANGGGAAFGAITVRHRKGQQLAGLLDALTYGIARIARDKTVVQLREGMGYLGRIQALEVTEGAHGWHPHRHPLALFDRPVNQEQLMDLHMAEFRAFRAGVVKRGYDAPLDLGQVLMPVSVEGYEPLGDYFAKSEYSVESASWEMAPGASKKGRRGSRTPWQLLESARRTGDADDLDLWHEYEKATRGKRALTFSRGLRELVGLGAGKSDEDVAAEEVGTAEDTGFRVADWAPFRQEPALGAHMLNAVARGGFAAGREFARENGIPIVEVER